MQSNTIICNRDKFSLYSHFYKSMGFQVTFINGYFGDSSSVLLPNQDETRSVSSPYQVRVKPK